MAMKKHTRLDLVEGGNIFKQGDYVTLGFIPRDYTGASVDLTNKQIEGSIFNGSTGVIYEGPASFVDGKIFFTIKQVLNDGKFQLEFTVTDAADPEYRTKFPTDDYASELTIKPSADNLDYVGVSMTTVAQLRTEQEQKQQQFEQVIVPQVNELKQRVADGIGAFTEDTEVLDARMGEPLLRDFNQKVVAQLAEKAQKEEVRLKTEKISQLDATDEFLEQIAGTAGINATPAREGVTRDKIADKAVEARNIDFAILSNNLFNPETLSLGKSINITTGAPVDNSFNDLSAPFYAKANQVYSAEYLTRWGAYDQAGALLATDSTQSFTTPANTHTLRLVIPKTRTYDAHINIGSTLLTYDDFKVEFRGGEKGLVLKPSFAAVDRSAMTDDSVDPFSMMTFKKPLNLFNKNNVIADKSIGSDDVETVDTTSVLTKGYVKVRPNTSYAKPLGMSVVVAFYRKNELIGQRTAVNTDAAFFTTPAWCHYIRFSVKKTSVETFMLNEGQTVLPYSPHVFELRNTPEFPLKIASDLAGSGGISESEVLSIMDDRLKPFRSHNYTKASYPDLIASLSSTGCEVEQLGLSSDGVNHLYGLKYGDTVNKPVIYIVAGQHGSEWQAVNYSVDFMKRISGATLMYDTALRDKLVAEFAFYLIVCANPYGYINDKYVNANGVNLNRNWDHNHESYDGGGLETNNKGPYPFSEPETQILGDKHILLEPYETIDCHTSGENIKGGIDTGKVYTEHRTMLLGTFNELFHIFDDAALPAMEWNMGGGPTLVGWSGKQKSKEGTNTIPTAVEQNTGFTGNYGLTALFAIAIATLKSTG